MANFMGGSAGAMANQVLEGFTLLSLATLRGYSKADLNTLRHELDKLLRTIRAETPPADDALAQQARNRKISRLSGALQVVGGQIMSTR
jgi:hypothetical protein